MVGHHRHGLAATSVASHRGARRRTRRSRRLWAVEGLENRLLLSGGPTIYTVNSTSGGITGSGDSGTLPYVIGLANNDPNTAGSEIEFDPSVFGSSQTITLSSTLALSETAGPEVIDGPGASLVTVSGHNAVEVFSVVNGVTATLTGLTISGGSAPQGGGIDNAGALTVTNCTITENNSVSYRGGGIANGGTLTVTNCTIDNNSAYNGSGSGGGIYLSGGTLSLTSCTIDNNSGGGIYVSTGALTVANSSIDKNSGYGGGIENGGTVSVTNSTIEKNSGISAGGIENSGTMTVTNSTIAYNSGSGAPGSGPGPGGIENDGTMTVTDSTIADNSAFVAGGGIDNYGTLTVTNSTIAGNSAYFTGGGLDVENGAVTVDNTIIALNTNGDISGLVSSTSAYNLIGTGGSGGLVNGTNGNQVGIADPGLGTLSDNGGPTQTIALLQGSPAIDAGSNALAVDPTTGQPLTTDQRGTGYPRVVDNTVDIGAFEVQPANHLAVTGQPPGSVTFGSGFGLTVTALDKSGNAITTFDGTVTVALHSNPGGATLGGTLTATARSGVATFAGLTLNKAGTGYTLLVSGNGLSSAATHAFNVTPAAASQLVVSTQPPSFVAASSGFGLVVSAEDKFGNVDPKFDGSVAIALLNNPGGATLGGTLTVSAQGGVANFSGLTLDKFGIGYTLQISSNGLTAATTKPFKVDAATVYMVDLTSANGTGSGNTGDLVYTIGLANANTNPDGSEIQFDPTVFSSPQTITLSSTLVLSETAGPEEVTDGPGASVVTVSGGNFLQVFSVANGVTAALAGLTISGGWASQGGGLSVDGGTVSLTNVTVINNQAEAGGGIYLAGGSLTLNDDLIASNVARSSFFGNGGSAAGGGIYVADGSLVLNNDVFESNQAIGGNGGNGSRGANGPAGENGGYGFSGRGAPPGMRGGLGGQGGAGGDGGAGYGGGVYVLNGTVTMTQAVFGNNSARGGRGGIAGAGGAGGLGGRGSNGNGYPGTGNPFADGAPGGAGGAGGAGGTGGQGGDGGAGGAGAGGGLYLAGGALMLASSSLESNSAVGGAGGVGALGGIGGNGGSGGNGGHGSHGSSEAGYHEPAPGVNGGNGGAGGSGGHGGSGGAGGEGGLGGAGGIGDGGGLYIAAGTVILTADTLSANGVQGGRGGSGGGGGHGESAAVGGHGGNGAPGGNGSAGAPSTYFGGPGKLTGGNGGNGGNGGFGGAGGDGGNGGIGNTGGNGGSASGGGVYVAGGTVTLTAVTTSGNVAQGAEGGVGGSGGGGGNPNAGGGGGPGAPAGSPGPGLPPGAPGSPGGAGGSGAFGVEGRGGSGGTGGNGGSATGGGLNIAGGSVTLINDTLSDSTTLGGANGSGGIGGTPGASGSQPIAGSNGAADGGGLYAGGGNVSLINSTVAGNSVATGGTGGGLDVKVSTATLDNSIVALNTNGSTTADDISGSVSSTSADNLIGTGGSGGLINGVNRNLVGVVKPGLGTLADNGGPTQTIALLPGSPAINAGSNALAVDPTTGQPLADDQRGPGFPRVVDGTVDIGAFEAPLPSSSVNALPKRASSLSFAVSVTGSDAVTATPAGVTTLDIYSSTNGGPWTLWTTVAASHPTATFSGQSNTTYAFYSIAHDLAGYVEIKSPRIEASTYLPDLTPPVTAVDRTTGANPSSVNTSTGTFTLNLTGSDPGGSVVTYFEVFVSVDSGTYAMVDGAAIPAGPADSSRNVHAAIPYQGLTDGAQHTYAFYSIGIDGAGNVQSAPATPNLSVTENFARPSALQVTSLVVENGAVERSYIRYVDVDFNESDSQSGSELTQIVKSVGTSTPDILLYKYDLAGDASSKAAVSLSGVSVAVIDHAIELDFGASGIGGNPNTTAADGYYELDVTLPNGQTSVHHFYRLLGDVTGDGIVDNNDLTAIAAEINLSSQSGMTPLNADVTGAGTVTAFDLTLATRAKGHKLGTGLSLG